MNTSSSIDQLRPRVAPLDADWSAQTLHRITQSPARRRRRRAVTSLALATAALIGTTGFAYAAGVVPAFVTEQFEWISPAPIHDEHRVASFTVPTEEGMRTFEMWRAENNAGETCTVVLEAAARFGPSFDGACTQAPVQSWFGWTSESAKDTEPMPNSTLYVYGEPADPEVRQVRVRAGDVTHTTQVDPEAGGYAVAVPEVTSDKWTERAGQVVAVVDFLDDNGRLLDTHTLRDR